MRTLLTRLLGGAPQSKNDAKQRLKVLLIHDQIDLTQAQLEAMKSEIIEVMNRYVEIDPKEVVLKLSRQDGNVALVSNVPVRRVTGARA